MTANTVLSRPEIQAKLTAAPLDVFVIGGGVVGSGVARDAAMRGLRTALVEQHDFAFGTSSRSSRLLHGGIRYLEQGRVGLVHEASVEKKTIRDIAPHLGDPLGFLFPSYKGKGWPVWQLRIGVKIYDLLCGGRNFQPSRGFNARETLEMLPTLRSEKLGGCVRYFDALTSDARLVYDTLTSAARYGATVANYLRFVDSTREGDLWKIQLEDKITGQKYVVQAKTIVNATGPWAEQIRHSSVKLRLSKGIHVVIDRSRLPVPAAVVITEGKRIIFVLPWGKRVIIGTTDTDYQGAPEDVRVANEDVTYVLRAVNDYFPSNAIKEKDIISSWAGIRPLIANPDGTPSDVSRAHQIKNPQPGWWDIAGGKLTTYRLMAEQAVDKIARFLGHSAGRSRTAQEPLLPTDVPNNFSGIVPPPVTREAVEHYVKNEWAVHLDDVLVRRSSWHYYESGDLAERVATWMAEIAGWTPERRAQEIAAYRAAVGVPVPPPTKR
ncbi:glycerol-3-phosphate dehydrogenase/oxidase [Opitutus sp. ER46]|uniref:glycerol-3-phosphate dehydrogenase/oxidase n=1 Tax=Opitutus sp. ER46 TaxID=2161864 RepID=UPI000D2F539D|nr:glycerol-3-phosphate dehydrogenase/oxidase [Opitutus sp. ER46]PTX91551.1 glycerol-3-phosphate dehydrogenase/oxidase [Opitutus sp. ER46]